MTDDTTNNNNNAPIVEAMAFYGKRLAEIRERRKAEAEASARRIAEANPGAWIDREAVAKRIERSDDDKAAEAEKQKGMERGAKNFGGLLVSAQTTARRLAVNGPVTIDDVIHAMRVEGFSDADVKAAEKGAPKNWKGSVFTDSDWVCVGSIASREKTAHGRHVRQWALKSWLQNHPVNGADSEASAFHLYKIYQEAAHVYPAGTELVFLLGKDMLASQYQEPLYGAVKYAPDGTVASQKGKTLYGCAVYPFDGVGAICLPRRALEQNLRSASILNKMSAEG